MLILKALLILFLIIQDHCSASPVMEEVIFYTVDTKCVLSFRFIQHYHHHLHHVPHIIFIIEGSDSPTCERDETISDACRQGDDDGFGQKRHDRREGNDDGSGKERRHWRQRYFKKLSSKASLPLSLKHFYNVTVSFAYNRHRPSILYFAAIAAQ